ncbi:hypothetical protein [Cyclobacterium roseum]|uniref:hypothetical protein n=1 Tax=Cyclobacterium roseum TaxID=2666137 RepID=UPI00139175BE|nr:hypothetical protein [Cyclobacterium roseum]
MKYKLIFPNVLTSVPKMKGTYTMQFWSLADKFVRKKRSSFLEIGHQAIISGVLPVAC